MLQDDHNLVLYDQSNAAIWNTKTNGRGFGMLRLVMQDDANLVLYDQSNQVHFIIHYRVWIQMISVCRLCLVLYAIHSDHRI